MSISDDEDFRRGWGDGGFEIRAQDCDQFFGGLTPQTCLEESLRCAARSGQLGLVHELLAEGACVECDENGCSALHYSASNGHADVVLVLLSQGCLIDIKDKTGQTALHRAASSGHCHVVKLLLESGSAVNKQDSEGNSALHKAAWHGYSKTVQQLLMHSANTQLTNKKISPSRVKNPQVNQGHCCGPYQIGCSALHLAAQNGHNQCSRFLLFAGCPANLKNEFGDTALHTATRYGHAGVARILLSARCQLNVKNKNGDTSLHIAAALRRRKVALMLIQQSINVNVRNKQGNKAEDIARSKDHEDILAILNSKGLRNEKRSMTTEKLPHLTSSSSSQLPAYEDKKWHKIAVLFGRKRKDKKEISLNSSGTPSNDSSSLTPSPSNKLSHAPQPPAASRPQVLELCSTMKPQSPTRARVEEDWYNPRQPGPSIADQAFHVSAQERLNLNLADLLNTNQTNRNPRLISSTEPSPTSHYPQACATDDDDDDDDYTAPWRTPDDYSPSWHLPNPDQLLTSLPSPDELFSYNLRHLLNASKSTGHFSQLSEKIISPQIQKPVPPPRNISRPAIESPASMYSNIVQNSAKIDKINLERNIELVIPKSEENFTCKYSQAFPLVPPSIPRSHNLNFMQYYKNTQMGLLDFQQSQNDSSKGIRSHDNFHSAALYKDRNFQSSSECKAMEYLTPFRERNRRPGAELVCGGLRYKSRSDDTLSCTSSATYSKRQLEFAALDRDTDNQLQVWNLENIVFENKSGKGGERPREAVDPVKDERREYGERQLVTWSTVRRSRYRPQKRTRFPLHLIYRRGCDSDSDIPAHESSSPMEFNNNTASLSFAKSANFRATAEDLNQAVRTLNEEIQNVADRRAGRDFSTGRSMKSIQSNEVVDSSGRFDVEYNTCREFDFEQQNIIGLTDLKKNEFCKSATPQTDERFDEIRENDRFGLFNASYYQPPYNFDMNNTVVNKENKEYGIPYSDLKGEIIGKRLQIANSPNLLDNPKF